MDEKCYHYSECMTMFRSEMFIVFGTEYGCNCDECPFRYYINKCEEE